MDAMTKDVTYKGYVEFEAQGKKYRVKPISLRDVVNGEIQKAGVILPADLTSPGTNMLYNMTNTTTRTAIGKWLEENAEFEGRPMSLTLACEHGWELSDIGLFVQKFLQISG